MRLFLAMAAACLVLSGSLGLIGCVPVLIGGLIYKSTKTDEEKNTFMTNFQRNNTEREKAHLAPLDWCSEAYKFDKGWATENAECAARVKQYEAGNASALAQ